MTDQRKATCARRVGQRVNHRKQEKRETHGALVQDAVVRVVVVVVVHLQRAHAEQAANAHQRPSTYPPAK